MIKTLSGRVGGGVGSAEQPLKPPLREDQWQGKEKFRRRRLGAWPSRRPGGSDLGRPRGFPVKRIFLPWVEELLEVDESRSSEVSSGGEEKVRSRSRKGRRREERDSGQRGREREGGGKKDRGCEEGGGGNEEARKNWRSGRRRRRRRGKGCEEEEEVGCEEGRKVRSEAGMRRRRSREEEEVARSREARRKRRLWGRRRRRRRREEASRGRRRRSQEGDEADEIWGRGNPSSPFYVVDLTAQI